MAEYGFETIKTLLHKSIENGWEAELTLYINSGEYNFASLDELYVAEQVDGIILERDWEKIEYFDCVDFEMQGFW